MRNIGKLFNCFSLIMCILPLCVFSGCDSCAHVYGDWQTIREATCEESGLQERVCEKCGNSDYGTIDATGHEYNQVYTVDIQPTATSDGLKSRHCIHEGCTATTDPQTIPKLGPDDENGGNTEPEDGGNTEPENGGNTEPENGGNTEPENGGNTEPENGGNTEPENGGNTEPENGGNTEPEENEEQDPMVVGEGIRPYGRDENGNVPACTLTEENGQGLITYRIFINRYNGFRLFLRPSIEVKNSDGDIVFTGNVPLAPNSKYDETEFCMLDIALPRGQYSVRPYNIVEGFEYRQSYTVSEKNGTAPYDTPEKYPTLEIRMTCHLTEGNLTSLKKGVVLPDFEIRSINKDTVSLSRLLAEKQIVIFNFYFNSCGYCIQEAPLLVKIYEEFKDKIAIVCVNTIDGNDDKILEFSQTWFKFPLDEFYIVSDVKNSTKLHGLVEHQGVPENIIIDSGGYVATTMGGFNEEWARRVLKYNLFEMPFGEASVTSANR